MKHEEQEGVSLEKVSVDLHRWHYPSDVQKQCFVGCLTLDYITSIICCYQDGKIANSDSAALCTCSCNMYVCS